MWTLPLNLHQPRSLSGESREEVPQEVPLCTKTTLLPDFSLKCFNISFYLSLAALRECAIKQGELEIQDKTVLTPASIQAAVSAIPSERMQSMVQEMQTLEDETVKVQPHVCA